MDVYFRSAAHLVHSAILVAFQLADLPSSSTAVNIL